MSSRKFRLVITTRLGARYLVHLTDKGYTLKDDSPSSRILMDAGEIEAAKKWSKKRLHKYHETLTDGQYAFVELAPGAKWPLDQDLVRKLDNVGRDVHRKVRIISGRRSLAQQTELWQAYQRYLNGGPYANLAAFPNANAPHIRGVAADCGVISRRGEYISIGNWSKSRKRLAHYNLVLCVPNEPWHTQRKATVR